MSTILPSIVCLKSAYNSKFLRYRTDDLSSHGLLQFMGDKFTDPVAQFDVIPSGSAGLVHLRSRYSNKFLVKWAPTSSMITASADKSNEDQTNWACTLFRPSFVDGDTSKIRLVHVQVGHYLNLARIQTPFNDCLFIGTEPIDPNSGDIFIVSDYTSLLKLPKNVAFKGENDKYLGPFLADGANYLQFSYENSSDPKVAHEVTSLPDGTITIKSKHLGKYWRLGANDWIFADAAEPVVSDSSSLFRVNVMDANVVSILNMKKTWYIKRYTQGPEMESLLKAAIQNVDEWSVIKVTDLGP